MEEEIISSVDFLKRGKVILYPTDTIWGIGCDATQQKPVTGFTGLSSVLKAKA